MEQGIGFIKKTPQVRIYVYTIKVYRIVRFLLHVVVVPVMGRLCLAQVAVS